MSRWSVLSNLRGRLLLLMLCIIIPAFGILLYNTFETRNREIEQARTDVLTLSQLAATQQEQVVEGTRQVLLSLAQLPEVQRHNDQACSDRLQELNQQYQSYTGLGVADPDGNLWCSAIARGVGTNIANRASFQTVLATSDFAVGVYQIGAASGKPSISSCYPVLTATNQIQGVVCGGLDVNRLNDIVSQTQLPMGASLYLLDREGTVIVQSPAQDLVGQPFPVDSLRQTILTQPEGQLQLRDNDGVMRIYAYNPVSGTGDIGMHLVVGIPTEVAFGAINQRLLRDLLIMTVVSLVTLFFAWSFSSTLVVRPVRDLAEAADRLGRGDLTARPSLPASSSEIGKLSHSFDAMARALEERQAAQHKAEADLRAQREWLKITLSSIGDAVIATDVNGNITLMNPIAQTLTGWPEADAFGRPLKDVLNLVNAYTREPAKNPVDRVLREGVIVGLANHTKLIARDGTEFPIDDSAAPIKDEQGGLVGAVLIFRDITEREKAELELRLSRDQLSVILQGAADGIIVQDRTGALRYANDAAARFIGYPTAQDLMDAPRGELNRRFEIFDEAGHPFPLERLPGRLVLQGAAQASATLRYRQSDTGDERWSADQATAIFDANGQVELAINILHDITELKTTEQSQRVLAEAGRLLSSALDASTRLTSLVQMVVPALADWCAVDVLDGNESIRRVAVAHVDPEKVALARELQERYPVNIDSPTGVPNVLRTGQSEYYPTLSIETLLATTRDEEQRNLVRELKLRSVMVVPLLAHGRTLGALTFVWAESGKQYTLTDLALAEELGRRAGLALDNALLYEQTQNLNARLEQRIIERTVQLETANTQLTAEIAERRLANRNLEDSRAQLRELSAYLQAAREEERAHIAREIHDELGQVLTTLKMDLASMQRSIANGEAAPTEPLRERMKIMSQSIDSTVQMVRRLATELRPSILDDLGLAAAIEWQKGDFQSRTGIQCDLEINLDESSVGPQARIALFRIFQETLTNVARHANATLIKIRLEEGAEYLTLQVQDNGRGITADDIAKSRSFGVLGMRERVRLLNGDFDINGVPGQGTTVTVRLKREAKPDADVEIA